MTIFKGEQQTKTDIVEAVKLKQEAIVNKIEIAKAIAFDKLAIAQPGLDAAEAALKVGIIVLYIYNVKINIFFISF